MCGICGIVSFKQGSSFSESIIREMCRVIRHRGPDDEGVYIGTANTAQGEVRVGLGQRRLSIIDLAGGHQPMANEDQTVWLVFNGEIYNHQELREELIAAGHQFATHSDTEAIIHAYEQYGEDWIKKLRGMFALALWDEKCARLILARDRVGIKPLYFAMKGGELIFGSELKCLLASERVERVVDYNVLDLFLTFEYISSPQTIFSGVNRILPGQMIIFENGKATDKFYWNLHFDSGAEREQSEDYYAERLRELLQESVKLRLMSDVPLGAFLSGGIDSSTVVALMSGLMDQPVKTFSIGFTDKSYNELDYARLVAKHFGTEHHELQIEPDAVELVHQLIEFIDEPFGDVSMFPTFLVSQLARKHVKVVLSGDGGDELFAGYDTYLAQRIDTRYYRCIPYWLRRKIIPRLLSCIPPTSQKKGVINKTKRFVEGALHPEELKHVRWMIFMGEEERKRLYTRELQEELEGNNSFQIVRDLFAEAVGYGSLSQQLYVDIKNYLPDDILVKVDRMSMANSLEARVPFLDHVFMEFVSSIPVHLKLSGNRTKYILRKAFDDLLPQNVLQRNKQGFSIPMKNWLRNELKPLLVDTLSEERVRKRGYFNWDYVHQLQREHINGTGNHAHRLWALMVFELWQRIYVD